jgi:hypothetical protein
MTGRTVNNAAVANYALDQIVLRAEELLPLLKPDVLVVGLMEAPILWTGYSALTRPKPYFMIEDGKLVSHNIPVPIMTAESIRANPLEPVKAYLGYSFLVNRLMASIDPEGWHATGGKLVTRAANDPVEISCRLLQRLKQKTDALKIRTILAEEVAGPERPDGPLFAARKPPGREQGCGRPCRDANRGESRRVPTQNSQSRRGRQPAPELRSARGLDPRQPPRGPS